MMSASFLLVFMATQAGMQVGGVTALWVTGQPAAAMAPEADTISRVLGSQINLDAFEATLAPETLEVARPLTQVDAVRAEMVMHSRTMSHAQALRVADLMWSESQREGVDPFLMLAIVAVESSYNHLALSQVGAEGLMQLMPGTAQFLASRGKIARIDNHTFDPELNVRLGARYLAELQTMFGHYLEAVLTAYNRGPAATRVLLRHHRGRLPPSIVRGYAGRVLQQYQSLRRLYGHLDRS